MSAESSRNARTPVGLAVRGLVLAVVVLVPMRILGQGYLPTDDAKRHAAKAVSDKDWAEILVLRPDMTLDSHPGWHAILRGLHRVTHAGPHSLVLFSVAFLFTGYCLLPVIVLRRPEAWLAVLLVLAVADPAALSRLLQGRPLLWSATAVLAFALFWRDLEKDAVDRRVLVGFAAVFAGATWLHGAWYLLVLCSLALVLARRWRAARRLTACWLAGVVGGAVLVGQPLAFLKQMIMHAYLAVGQPQPTSTLAVEFTPFGGAPLIVVATVILILWTSLHQRLDLGSDPVFLLGVLGWSLGFIAIRFWSDWAVPAWMTWMALQLEDRLVSAGAARRFVLAASLALTTFLALTADVGGRWSTVDRTFAPLTRKDARPMLPDPGGVIYSGEMRIFFELFYVYPEAPWRYVVGYEPGAMLPEDRKVYRRILETPTAEALTPWVAKMLPADRLIIRSIGAPPPIPRLEWRFVGGPFWSGRLAAASAAERG
jgi:hypothetical protein